MWKHFFMKMTSARWIVTLAIIFTLCHIVEKSMNLAIASVYDEKVFNLVKEIVMFILGAFISVVTNIVTSYFQRQDRVENGPPKQS